MPVSLTAVASPDSAIATSATSLSAVVTYSVGVGDAVEAVVAAASSTANRSSRTRSPSTAGSSTPVTVTVCGTVQLSGVNVTVAAIGGEFGRCCCW